MPCECRKVIGLRAQTVILEVSTSNHSKTSAHIRLQPLNYASIFPLSQLFPCKFPLFPYSYFPPDRFSYIRKAIVGNRAGHAFSSFIWAFYQNRIQEGSKNLGIVCFREFWFSLTVQKDMKRKTASDGATSSSSKDCFVRSFEHVDGNWPSHVYLEGKILMTFKF